jgi:hypothetical protein
MTVGRTTGMCSTTPVGKNLLQLPTTVGTEVTEVSHYDHQGGGGSFEKRDLDIYFGWEETNPSYIHEHLY